jgi:indole-3-glycerol phosphate synthase
VNILDKLVASTKIRLEREKKSGLPANKVRKNIPFLFENTLKRREMSFICEIKKASPSKGIIANHFPYVDLAREYENAGADAISVLTEPEFFEGRIEHLAKIKEAVNIPVLRKDFIIDPFQIEQSAALGADAILLICSILTEIQLGNYIKMADLYKMSCLVEAHNEDEIKMALSSGARIIGVNNRDLRTFSVDTSNSIRLRKMVPRDIIFVSESGIKTGSDVALLHENEVDAVLIGETMMRASDKVRELNSLRGTKVAV